VFFPRDFFAGIEPISILSFSHDESTLPKLTSPIDFNLKTFILSHRKLFESLHLNQNADYETFFAVSNISNPAVGFVQRKIL